MRIAIEKNDDLVPYRFCFICGEQYETTRVMAVAYTGKGVRIARVCNECIKAGPDGLKVRAHNHASKLANATERANRLVEWLTQEELQVPTYGEIEQQLKDRDGRY